MGIQLLSNTDCYKKLIDFIRLNYLLRNIILFFILISVGCSSKMQQLTFKIVNANFNRNNIIENVASINHVSKVVFNNKLNEFTLVYNSQEINLATLEKKLKELNGNIIFENKTKKSSVLYSSNTKNNKKSFVDDTGAEGVELPSLLDIITRIF